MRHFAPIAVATVALGVAALTPAQEAPTATEFAVLLRALDASFDAGDVDGYLARFDADHPGALAVLGHHLGRLLAVGAQRSRKSVALTEPRRIGPRWVVRVQHTVDWSAVGATAPRTLVEHSYLAVRRGDDGLVPTFAVEMPTQLECVREDTLRCRACNYEIGGVDGWLCVPLRSDRAPAIEAASFYLVGTDVACDVSVQPTTRNGAAATAAQRLARALVDLEPTAQPGLAAQWLPPDLAAAPPVGLEGARVEVELPGPSRDATMGRAVFHVVAFGGLEHVMLVRGSAQGLADAQPAVEALLESYRLLEPSCELAELASQSLRHHTGGAIDGATYTNERYMVELRGPAGWRVEQLPGGAAFRVVWSNANGSRLWLVGYAPPVGLAAWTPEHADRWLDQQFAGRGLEPEVDPEAAGAPDPARADAWSLVGSVREKALVLRAAAPTDATAPLRRLFRARLADDLLLVADGHGATAADEAAVRAALATMKRD